MVLILPSYPTSFDNLCIAALSPPPPRFFWESPSESFVFIFLLTIYITSIPYVITADTSDKIIQICWVCNALGQVCSLRNTEPLLIKQFLREGERPFLFSTEIQIWRKFLDFPSPSCIFAAMRKLFCILLQVSLTISDNPAFFTSGTGIWPDSGYILCSCLTSWFCEKCDDVFFEKINLQLFRK